MENTNQTDFSKGAKYLPVTAPMDNEYAEVAWGLTDHNKGFEQITINRPKPVGDFDVKVELLYCGVCHSDLHAGRNHFAKSIYPLVPGHEAVGKVVAVGSKVTKVKVGDSAGIGPMSDSCLDCEACGLGDEQYCLKGKSVGTYNDKKRYSHIGGNPDSQTFGGYAGSNTLHEHFIMKVPDGLPLDKAGPILCAGVTMYDPLRHFGATQGTKMTIGIVGIGGLGTMGIKLSKALGHKVIAISTSANKRELALQKGADEFVVSTDPASVESQKSTCNLILNTVSAAHEVAAYLPLLRYNGTIVQLGLVNEPHTVSQMPLIHHRKALTGSHIGGIQATEECLELCAKHGILPECETITADRIDWAFAQLDTSNKDGIRYVIDIKKSLENKQ